MAATTRTCRGLQFARRLAAFRWSSRVANWLWSVLPGVVQRECS
jgi:hypothetical protein